MAVVQRKDRENKKQASNNEAKQCADDGGGGDISGGLKKVGVRGLDRCGSRRFQSQRQPLSAPLDLIKLSLVLFPSGGPRWQHPCQASCRPLRSNQCEQTNQGHAVGIGGP